MAAKHTCTSLPSPRPGGESKEPTLQGVLWHSNTQTHTHIPHHTDRLMFFDGSAIKKNVLLLQRTQIQLLVSTSGSSQPFAVLAPGDLMSPSGLCRHYTNTHTPHTSTHTEPIRPGLQLRRHTEGAVCLPGMHKAPGFHLRHRIHSRDCSLYETEHF